MISLHLLLLALALVLFLLSAFGVPGRVNWQGLGLALVTLSWLLR